MRTRWQLSVCASTESVLSLVFVPGPSVPGPSVASLFKLDPAADVIRQLLHGCATDLLLTVLKQLVDVFHRLRLMADGIVPAVFKTALLHSASRSHIWTSLMFALYDQYQISQLSPSSCSMGRSYQDKDLLHPNRTSDLISLTLVRYQIFYITSCCLSSVELPD